MPEEQKSFYDVRKWGDNLRTGEELKITHNLYFHSNHADLTPLVAQSPAELERQITASEEKEQEIFQKLCAAVSEWEVQGAQTLLLRKAMEYVKTPAVKHTSNQWVKDNYDRMEISNMVYVMRYRIHENTSYDHKLKKSVPTSWTVSWGIAFNAPKKRENPYASYQFDGQDQKRYTDKEKAEKYVQGRFKQYAHLFTEISPQIPEDKAHIFRVNGHLLPGYSVQPHVPTPQELLDFVEDQDISTLIPDEPNKPAAKQPQKKAPAKSRGDAR